MNKTSKTPTRRQPPSQHQFKSGQSGNPSGRPKGSPNKVTRGRFARMFLEEAERDTAGPQTGVSLHRAALRGLLEAAASGNLKAMKLLLPLAAEAEAVAADLDEVDENRAAEAEEAQRARVLGQANAERRAEEVTQDEALARQPAAGDPDLYRLARTFAPLNDRSPKPMRFTEAVGKARTYAALGLNRFTNYDPFMLEAALLARQQEGDVVSDDDDR